MQKWKTAYVYFWSASEVKYNNVCISDMQNWRISEVRTKQTWPAVPRAIVNLKASVPYSLIVSKGSMTFPNVLDIFRPWNNNYTNCLIHQNIKINIRVYYKCIRELMLWTRNRQGCNKQTFDHPRSFLLYTICATNLHEWYTNVSNK